MPCTPTNGLSHSYISQWANLTMLNQSSSIDTIPSLDPIPSPVRGRVRRRKDENDDECPTPRDRMSNCSPQPRVANRSRPSRRQAPPTLLPTLHFRRLAHKPLDRPPLQRTPSDVTNKQRDEDTPSPDLIFNMSPVLGLDGPSRPNWVASHLSEELLKDTPQTPQPASFMYAYTWDTATPPPPYAQSLTISAATSGLLADNDHTSEADESALSHLEESELASCLVDIPAMPRLGRLHAKSDPLPARLSSSPASFLDSGRAQPIPIPKPSLRVPSDYGGVSSISMSVAPPTQTIPMPARYARVPAAARERKKRRDVPVPVHEEPELEPVPAVRRKKRFFLGESYDGDMDSELSSWRP